MTNILEDFDVFVKQMQSTNGRTDKEVILEKYKDNENIKTVLDFLYNPYIITGLSDKKIAKKVTRDPNCKFEDLLSVLAYLKKHNSGKDTDIANITHFISHNYEYADLIRAIVTKNLKLGVQPKTINKIYGENFIPQFNVMLAERYFEDPDKYLPKGTRFLLSTKLDGVRAVCVYKSQEQPCFFTRQGQPINGLVDIYEEIKSHFPSGYVYDGEILLSNTQNLKSEDLYRKTVKVVNSDSGNKHGLIYNIFDIIPTEEFFAGKSIKDAEARKKQLVDIFHNLNTKLASVRNVNTLYAGQDQTEIEAWLNEITSNGGEGIMINIASAPYECKRTKGLLKVKKFQTMDLRCIDVEEGGGVNVGALGAIVVEYPAPDANIYNVRVGSGFTATERDVFWRNPEKIVGKIVEIQYFEVSQNEKGGYSLRFPIFKWVREDKDEPSTF